jgi:hypothetical protein
MGAVDPTLSAVLDELAPPRPAPDGWDAIVAAARPRRRPALVVAPAVVAAAILVAVLAWPFGGRGRGSILDRAAAAIGTGPVLHVVVQDGFHGTQVDLATGARTDVYQLDELWYDPERGVREVETFGGVVQDDATYPPSRVQYLDRTLAFLATDYRDALKNGTARLLGDGDVDGTPVYWIRVDTQMLPDTSDGKLHEWAHDVAVAQDTLKPVATRETRDGRLSPDGISRVESVESLAASSFAPSSAPRPSVALRFELTGSLTRDEASAVLGAPLVAAGDSVGGLPLTRIAKEIRGDGSVTHDGVMLFYGPAAGGGIGQVDPSSPYVRVGETLTLDDQFQRGVRDYSPPDGSVLVFGGRIGVMQAHGVHLALEASSEDLLLAAARALANAGG